MTTWTTSPVWSQYWVKTRCWSSEISPPGILASTARARAPGRMMRKSGILAPGGGAPVHAAGDVEQVAAVQLLGHEFLQGAFVAAGADGIGFGKGDTGGTEGGAVGRGHFIQHIFSRNANAH